MASAPDVPGPVIATCGPSSFKSLLLEEIDTRKGIWIESFKKDSFGRWLCEIYSHESGESLNERMLTEGYAVPYKR